jgi:hypothetical protein
MIEYIRRGFRASFKFCMGDKLREEMEGGKRDENMQILFFIKKTFSVHLNVHTP